LVARRALLRLRSTRPGSRHSRGSGRQPASGRTLEEDRSARVEELIQRLKAEAAEGAILIVEGRRDAQALRRIDVHGAILSAKSSGFRLLDFAERIDRGRKVIVLTDFDAAGERLARFLRQALERERVRVDLTYRKRLSALMHGEVAGIEGLSRRLQKLRPD